MIRFYNDKEYSSYRLITGNCSYFANDEIVGFCKNKTHVGYLTKNILKQHECLAKKCPFLYKNESIPYWEKIKKEEAIKRKGKQGKRILHQRRIKEQNVQNRYMTTAERISREMGFNLLFTGMMKKYDKLYMLFFVSDKPYNDWYEYRDLIPALADVLGINFYLRHTKDVNGQYATINDVLQKNM